MTTILVRSAVSTRRIDFRTDGADGAGPVESPTHRDQRLVAAAAGFVPHHSAMFRSSKQVNVDEVHTRERERLVGSHAIRAIPGPRRCQVVIGAWR